MSAPLCYSIWLDSKLARGWQSHLVAKEGRKYVYLLCIDDCSNATINRKEWATVLSSAKPVEYDAKQMLRRITRISREYRRSGRILDLVLERLKELQK